MTARHLLVGTLLFCAEGRRAHSASLRPQLEQLYTRYAERVNTLLDQLMTDGAAGPIVSQVCVTEENSWDRVAIWERGNELRKKKKNERKRKC